MGIFVRPFELLKTLRIFSIVMSKNCFMTGEEEDRGGEGVISEHPSLT